MKKGNWSIEEIEFLKNYYLEYGTEYCSEYLNRTKDSIRYKTKQLRLIDVNKIERYDEDNFKKIVKSSYSYSEVARKLEIKSGDNINTIKKYIDLYKLDISHFDRNKNRLSSIKKPLKDILVKNSTYGRNNLKKRLYKEGLKKRNCEMCGQGEYWRGKYMGLILDHINGIRDDNRLKNLRIVCPNCNSTLDTHAGRKNKIYKKCKMSDCNNQVKDHRQTFCSSVCYRKNENNCLTENTRKHTRKVERPPYDQLKKEIEETSYVQVGKKYGVSDNTIRKWIKHYEKYMNK